VWGREERAPKHSHLVNEESHLYRRTSVLYVLGSILSAPPSRRMLTRFRCVTQDFYILG